MNGPLLLLLGALVALAPASSASAADKAYDAFVQATPRSSRRR